MRYMSCKQAAKVIGVTDSRIRHLIRLGEIRAERVGWEWLIDVAEVNRIKSRPRSGAGRPRLTDKRRTSR